MSAAPATPSPQFPPVYSVGPKFLRAVCWGCAILVLIGLAALLWIAPGTTEGSFDTPDVIAWFTIAGLILAVLWRFGRARIFVTEQGVRVRNFFHTYEYAWPQILRVAMTTADPWALLELNDGTTCTVLALPASEVKASMRCVADLRLRIQKFGETNAPQ